MNSRRMIVDRLDVRRLRAKYDLAIGAVGYEKRSRFFFEAVRPAAEIRIAAAFDMQQIFSFEENVTWFEQNDFEVNVVRDRDYSRWLASSLQRVVAQGKSQINVIADISSLSRVRIAHLISTLRDSPLEVELVLDVVYCLAKYVPPLSQLNPNSHVGPVTEAFAGWWSEPDRQLSAIVGLGYEQEKALGAVEYLEAQEVWVFEPKSVIRDYSKAIEVSNTGLLADIKEDHRFQYRIEDPFACLSNLRSLTLGLSARSNVVLLPFGPKIFALCSFIVGASLKDVAVWRVSAQNQEIAVDRERRYVWPSYQLPPRVTVDASTS